MNRLGRLLFVLCLIITWGAAVDNLVSAHGTVAVASVAFVAAAYGFFKRRQEALSGALLFLMLAGITWAQEHQWPGAAGIRPTNYLPAAVLAGFLTARCFRRDPRGLWEGACGVFAAGYLLAALAKLRGSGFAWMDGRTLGLLVAERAFSAPPIIGALRLDFAARPMLCQAAAAGALLVEAGAVVFLYPGARTAYSLAVTLLHLGIFLLMGFVEPGWPLLAWALSLLSTEEEGPVA